MKRLTTRLLVGLLCLFGALPALAGEPEDIGFDIFLNADSVAVLIEYDRYLTSPRITGLKDGIDLAFEYTVSINRPRRLWGAEKVAQRSGTHKLGYRTVTDDFTFISPTDPELSERTFLSLRDLHRYFSDSIFICLMPVDSLDRGSQYYLDIKLTLVSLTRLNVTDSENTSGEGKSAVKWLFEGFLDLTNFGREDFKTRSRTFSPEELAPRD